MVPPLTPHTLARYANGQAADAATAYEQFLPLRAIGAPVPELPAQALEALRGQTPDRRDLLALSGSHRVSEAGTPYGPLDILGEPLPRTPQPDRRWA